MKKHINNTIFFVVFCCGLLHIKAQTSTENYIQSTTYQKPFKTNQLSSAQDDDKIETITYYDGLGREKQSVARQSGGNKQDIITHYEYDSYGRKAKSYLPYAKVRSNTGQISTLPLPEIGDFYNTEKYENTTNPFSEVVFESSPLNRVLQVAAPGEDWKVIHGHTIRNNYEYNVSSDEVILFEVDLSDDYTPTLKVHPNGYYAANELYKNIVKDENWVTGKDHTTEEFTNKKGQVVLKRTYDSNVPHDTHYVYDDYGNLTYVLPPKVDLENFISPGQILTYPDYEEQFSYKNFIDNPQAQEQDHKITFKISSNDPNRLIITGNVYIDAGVQELKLDQALFTLNFPSAFPSMDINLGEIEATTENGTILNHFAYISNNSIGLFGGNHTNQKITFFRFNFDIDLAANGYTINREMFQVATNAMVGDESKISQDILNALAYQYKYDDRNRLVEKKIPGKGWEYIVYNKADQPVLTQDTNQRPKNEWLFTKYDALGRVVYTGLHKQSSTNIISRTTMQGYVNNSTGTYETKINTTTPVTIGNGVLYYTNTVFPTVITELYTINYYDNYSFDLSGGTKPNALIFGAEISDRTHSLSTGSKVRVLNTNKWITSVTYYDNKARVLYGYSKNEFLNTVDEVKTDYDDFVGRVLKTRSRHKKDTNDAIVTIDVFTYDHIGRLLGQNQCIGDDTLTDCESSDLSTEPFKLETLVDANFTGPFTELFDYSYHFKSARPIVLKPGFSTKATSGFEFSVQQVKNNAGERIVSNTYDELGQLIAKKVGGGLQTIDYTYNIRGWLKGINDVNILGDDLFSFKINYNTTGIEGSKALFNGNISETHWKTANDNTKRSYQYRYDALNRLTVGSFLVDNNTNGGSAYYESMNYDKNGNITKLYRFDERGYHSMMDNLDYFYASNSNKLTSVNDEGDAKGFKDGSRFGPDYTYDTNGNMTTDKNKGITDIEYNHLNLPTNIYFGVNKKLNYIYDATGMKLMKVQSELERHEDEWTVVKDIVYAGNYVYENEDNLKFLNHSEGYIEPESDGTYTYVYQYKDHLGNIRLSYSDKNKNGNIDVIPGSAASEVLEEKNYYPFGLEHKGYNNTITGREHPYGYNGKEEQNELGLEWLDFGWRNYDAAIGRWMNLDPLAEGMRKFSPYNYAWDNPINVIDPDGMFGIFVNENGQQIGDDGINDGKVYVVKTDTQSVETGAPVDGITTEQKNATVSFIQNNSGNTAAFEENSIAYDNSVEIEGSENTRQSMVDIVNQDDGTGGTNLTKPQNAIEYGGTVENNGSVIESANTGTDSGLTVNPTANTKSTFHSHTSAGTKVEGGVLVNQYGPSSSRALGEGNGDIGSHQVQRTNYVFERKTGDVIIYNSRSGVQAIIPQKNFVKLPKKQ